MKKISIILLLSFSFINFMFISAKAASYKVNDIVEDKFFISKKFVIDLPKGQWIIAEKSSEYYYGLRSKIYSLLRLENKKAVEGIEIAEMHTAGIYETYVNIAIYEAMFKNKFDGCYERPEYSIVRFFRKGSTHDCFWVGHFDVYKELFTPEDPDLKTANAQLRRYIKQNKIELPKVALFSNHSYFSRLRAGKWYAISYQIDPKILGGPKNKFITEDSSEYHRNNIENYPEHKKIMEKWISISAKRHKDFENSINALDRHKLDLDDLIYAEVVPNTNNSKDISSQIQKLYDLYKNEVLSKEEFEKAKKKLLN
tara:strand:- start:27 stop:962 length:936 start_codon:yes stop_codon:yes gene_type:complete